MNTQKQRFRTSLVLVLTTILTSISIHAQWGGYTMYGPSQMYVNESGYFSISGSSISSTTWSTSSYGSILSSSNTGASAKFTYTGQRSVSATVRDSWYNYHYLTRSVNVGVRNPNNPTVSNNNCGDATLTRSGSPPSGVRWYWQGKNASGTSTSKGYGSTFVANEGNGTYYIRARHTASGQWSSSSGSVSVTIVNFTPGAITGAHTICYSGDPNTLSSTGSAAGGSGGYTYQWQISTNGSSGWSNISGATSTSYNPPGNLTASRWYRRRVTSCSGQNLYTNVVKVTVNANLNPGSISGTQTICYGGDPSTLSNSSSASGGNSTKSYQWQYSGNGNNGWTNISGATSTTYNPPSNLTTSRWYRRRVISCGQTKYTGTVKVTVHSNLVAGSIGNAQTLCYTDTPSSLTNNSSASGGNGSYSYQWQISTNNSTWSSISGATSTTYIPPGQISGDRWFRRRVISCGQTKYTGSIKVTIYAEIVTPTAPSVVQNCGNTILTRTSPPNGITWYWQSTSGGTSTSDSNTTITLANGNTYYLRGRNSSGCWGPARTISYSVLQPTNWYADNDKDGQGNSGTILTSCTQPVGYVSNSNDYDDSTVLITNLAPQLFYEDRDGDGFGDGNASIYASFPPNGYASNNLDQCPNAAGPNNGCQYRAPSLSNENYIYTRTYQQPMSNAVSIKDDGDVLEHVSYLDGLGRPTQEVALKASGSGVLTQNIPTNVNEWAMDWTQGIGGTPFYNRIGETEENQRIYSPTPFGTTDLVWQCGNDTKSDPDGGWNTDYFNIDITASYRYSVWVKRTHSNAGTTYHGTQNVDNLNGSANNNPYFWSGDLPQLNTWYLLVGVVHPHNYTGGDTGISGVYDMQGNRIIDGTEFKWRTSTSSTRFRSYYYYSTDVNARQYFYGPNFQQINGGETPLIGVANAQAAKDIVSQVGYDAHGRQHKEYLPYVAFEADGSFKSDAATMVNGRYMTEFSSEITTTNPNPYSETAFEASPLNRAEKQAAPGSIWGMGSGHEIKFSYQSNGAQEVRLFEVSTSFANNTYTPSLQESGYYQPGELSKTITKDENHPGTATKNHTTEEFTDKLGRVILKRTYENEIPHDTFYVYDIYGNLSYVLPPLLEAQTASLSTLTTNMDDLGYQYVYDDRNRLVEKQLPGKGRESIVYNKLDQPIMTQDAVQAVNGEWLFTKYDAFGRVAYTGLFLNSSNRSSQQTAANAISTQFEGRSAGTIPGQPAVYYTSNAYPTSFNEVYTVNYYDSYQDTDGLSVPSSVLEEPTTNQWQGLATVSKVRVLTTNDWITTITGYDHKGRAIYTASKNNYLNSTDVVESQLDFTGKPLWTRTTHTKGSLDPLVIDDFYTYDRQGRLLTHSQMLAGETRTIASNSYDERGQLIQKAVGGLVANTRTQLKDLLNVTQVGKTISKPTAGAAWDNTDGITSKSIEGDGYLQWIVPQTTRALMVGLAPDNPSTHYNTIDYALYTRHDGIIHVFENGVHRGSFGAYAAGDTFRVERQGSTIYYKKNGSVFYTSTISTIAPLHGNISFFHTGSTIRDLVLNDSDTPSTPVPLQEVDYAYNVRGWLKGINEIEQLDNDLFSFKINYNNPEVSGIGVDGLYNGNISETLWRTVNDGTKRANGYLYDALNRLKVSRFTDNMASYTGQYNSAYSYDKNGNLLSLARNTDNGSGSYQQIDNLVYGYDGANKLVSVVDNSGHTDGFNDQNTSGNDYGYDINGNMTSDANKGISTIIYNHLNLPTGITLNAGSIAYIYDATGQKLKKTVGSITTEYAGNFIYEGNDLQFFSHPEGYISPDGNGGYDYVYQYKDHLGNVRLSFQSLGDTYKDLVSSDFTSDLDGWAQNGSTNPTLENGRVKVNVNSAWEGMKRELPGFLTTAGEVLQVRLVFDKGNTQSNVRLYLHEIDSNGNLVAWNSQSSDLQTGTHVFNHTMANTGNRIILRIDKNNTNTSSNTHFYLDYVSLSQGSLEIIEESNYYPFGLKHKGYNIGGANSLGNDLAQKWKYNGKELDESLGLNMYDYGARSYQPDLGRWTSIDPASHEYVGISPYSYAANNPNVFTDPDGKRLFFVGGAGNDADGWEYITRWGNFMTDAGIRNFVRINASNGKPGDIAFTHQYRNSGYEFPSSSYPRDPQHYGYATLNPFSERAVQHDAIDRAVEQIEDNIANSPLEDGEQFNLAGYSYGSVLQAQVALRLANKGQYIDNLILIGSPISEKSDLMEQLKGNKNIGKVIRYDIKDDLLSDPKSILEFIQGGIQNGPESVGGEGDNGPHFDLARPGNDADQLIQTVIQWLRQQGVE